MSMSEGCAVSLVRQVACILVYDQDCMDSAARGGGAAPPASCGASDAIAVQWFDTVLNHVLVVANADAALSTMRAIHAYKEREGFRVVVPSYFAACLCFVFVVAFQLLLCLTLKCSGVSIVWCSVVGWRISLMGSIDAFPSRVLMTQDISVPERSSSLRNHVLGHRLKRTIRASYFIGLDCLVLICYAVTMDAMTTVAHLCAIALGVALWKMALYGRVG